MTTIGLYYRYYYKSSFSDWYQIPLIGKNGTMGYQTNSTYYGTVYLGSSASATSVTGMSY